MERVELQALVVHGGQRLLQSNHRYNSTLYYFAFHHISTPYCILQSVSAPRRLCPCNKNYFYRGTKKRYTNDKHHRYNHHSANQQHI